MWQLTVFYPQSGILLLVVILIFVYTVRFCWKRRHLYYWANKVPGPLAFPLIGAGYLFTGSPPEAFKKMMDMFVKYPILGKLWLGTKLFYVVAKPELFELILNHPGAIEKTELYRYMKTLGGDGLISGPANVWRQHRKIIAPTFNQKILKEFMEVINKNGELLLEKWAAVPKGQEVTAYLQMTNCTLDIICESIFGTYINAQVNDRNYGVVIDEWMDIVFMRIFKVWYQYDFIFRWTKDYQNNKQYVKEVNKITSEIIQRKQRELQEKAHDAIKREVVCTEEEAKRKPLLEHLLKLPTFTEEELRDEINTFLLAGTDTNATSNCFTLLLLGIHQDIQQKLYDEVIDVLGPDKSIEMDDLSNLKYTERVIKESLRIFPVVALIGRLITDDISVGDIILPKGAQIVLGYFHTHRSEKYWPEPLKFNPDRFLPEEVSQRHTYSWLPFSGGPRNCIGGKFALMIMKTLLAMIVRRFKIRTTYTAIEEVHVKMGIVLKPRDGFKIYLDPR